MSRITHVSEPKWFDDPYEEERFEERQQRDMTTATLTAVILAILFVLGVLLGVWAFVSTVEPGSDAHRQVQEVIMMTGIKERAAPLLLGTAHLLNPQRTGATLALHDPGAHTFAPVDTGRKVF